MLEQYFLHSVQFIGKSNWLDHTNVLSGKCVCQQPCLVKRRSVNTECVRNILLTIGMPTQKSRTLSMCSSVWESVVFSTSLVWNIIKCTLKGDTTQCVRSVFLNSTTNKSFGKFTLQRTPTFAQSVGHIFFCIGEGKEGEILPSCRLSMKRSMNI